MANFARIIDGVAIDVSADPASNFHPEIASQFVAVPDKVGLGWLKTGSTWAAPATVDITPAPVYPIVSPIAFQMLFTPAEMVAAIDLQKTDKTLAAFWKLVDDPRTDQVDLGLDAVQNAVEYTLTVIKASGTPVDIPVRKAAILNGVVT